MSGNVPTRHCFLVMEAPGGLSRENATASRRAADVPDGPPRIVGSCGVFRVSSVRRRKMKRSRRSSIAQQAATIKPNTHTPFQNKTYPTPTEQR